MAGTSPVSRASSAERGRWAAFIACLGGAALAVLDISKINVAVPAIQVALGAGPTAVQLIVGGYVLAFGVALIPFGRAGDLRSRKTIFLFGVALFGVASLACATAASVELLVAARVLEGIAAGAMMPQALGMIQQLFSGAERGKAFGLYGAMIGLTVAVAPPLGGVLVELGGEEFGWRLVFLMNVPLALCIFILGMVLLPKIQRHQPGRTDLDPVGVFLLALTILAFMVPFILTTGTRVDSPWRWLLLPGSLVLGIALALWERRYRRLGRTPVIDFALFDIRGYRNGVFIALAYYAGSPAAMLLTALLLQNGFGASALYSGLAIVPFSAAYIVSAWWTGNMTNRWGRKLVVVGLAMAMVGWSCAATAALLLPASAGVVVIPAVLIVAGLGAGAVAAPNQTLMLAEVPPESGGLAGSVAQVAQRLGAALGIAAVVALFYGQLAGDDAAEGPDYAHAYFVAMGAVASLFVVALVLAVRDQRWRRSR